MRAEAKPVPGMLEPIPFQRCKRMKTFLKMKKTLELQYQQVLKGVFFNGLNLDWDWTYLKDGIGDPCAGHIKARLAVATSSNERELILEANFGAALPIGSKNCGHSFSKNILISYLNPGTGNPCAGHIIAMGWPRISR